MNSLSPLAVDIATAADGPAIEHLLDLAFGLGRYAKTSYRLREGNHAVPGLSFVRRDPILGLSGSISFWPLKIGLEGSDALLLGPLAVHPKRENLGIGRALMTIGLEKAKAMGCPLVILVGDEPYYARLGFKRVPEGLLTMPGPVDPKRLLSLDLEPGALSKVHGLVLAPHRYTELSAALAVPHGAKRQQQKAEACEA